MNRQIILDGVRVVLPTGKEALRKNLILHVPQTYRGDGVKAFKKKHAETIDKFLADAEFKQDLFAEAKTEPKTLVRGNWYAKKYRGQDEPTLLQYFGRLDDKFIFTSALDEPVTLALIQVRSLKPILE